MPSQVSLCSLLLRLNLDEKNDLTVLGDTSHRTDKLSSRTRSEESMIDEKHFEYEANDDKLSRKHFDRDCSEVFEKY